MLDKTVRLTLFKVSNEKPIAPTASEINPSGWWHTPPYRAESMGPVWRSHAEVNLPQSLWQDILLTPPPYALIKSVEEWSEPYWVGGHYPVTGC